eukprot:1316918-Pyramimonas_sp.AAC.1
MTAFPDGRRHEEAASRKPRPEPRTPPLHGSLRAASIREGPGAGEAELPVASEVRRRHLRP